MMAGLEPVQQAGATSHKSDAVNMSDFITVAACTVTHAADPSAMTETALNFMIYPTQTHRHLRLKLDGGFQHIS